MVAREGGMMSSTYLVSIGEDEMLGIGTGADPAAAVYYYYYYYATLDSYCSPSDEITERFSVSTLKLPDDAAGEVDALIERHGADALPDIEHLVVAAGLPAEWQVVDVVIEAGGRTVVLRG